MSSSSSKKVDKNYNNTNIGGLKILKFRSFVSK